MMTLNDFVVKQSKARRYYFTLYRWEALTMFRRKLQLRNILSPLFSEAVNEKTYMGRCVVWLSAFSCESEKRYLLGKNTPGIAPNSASNQKNQDIIFNDQNHMSGIIPKPLFNPVIRPYFELMWCIELERRCSLWLTSFNERVKLSE